MWQFLGGLLVYLAVGAALALPIKLAFGWGLDSNIYLWFTWLWPLWVGAILLISWLAVSLFSKGARGPIGWAREWLGEWQESKARALQRARLEAEKRAEDLQKVYLQWQKAASHGPPTGPRNGIKARVPKDADDFESVCAEWLRRCGVTDAKRTAKGPDGGLDVFASGLGGQCKFHPSQKTSAPEIQQLAGAAQQAEKQQKVFFHYGPGYTDSAKVAAKKLDVDLWQFDVDKVEFRQVR